MHQVFFYDASWLVQSLFSIMYIHSCASRKVVPRTFEFQQVSVDMTIFKLQKPIPHPPFLKSMMADFCH